MDAFQRAVDDARRQLGISVSELLRRAGFPDRTDDAEGLTARGARYHLEPANNALRKGGHRIPPELVTKLAAVLPVEEEELHRAAQVAAGFTVTIDPAWSTLPVVLARYLGDEEVSEEEKRETTARLLEIIEKRRDHG